MAMSVNETGSDGEAVEIENTSGFWREPTDFIVGANDGDFAVVNGYSLGDGIMSIDRDDLSVEEDKIGCELRGQRACDE